MHARLSWPRAVIALLTTLGPLAATCGCSPAASEGTNGGSSSGGSASGGEASPSTGGGTTGIVLAPEMDIVTPEGPGDSGGLLCPAFDCIGSSFEHQWILDHRCDLEGSWEDPECSGASFSWTLVSAAGSFTHGSIITWKMDTTTDWVISYPAACGGCAALEAGRLAGPFASFSEQLESSWQTLDCQETTQGDCECSGTLTRTEDYYGQGVGDQDENGETAGRYLVREYPSEKNVGFLAVEHKLKLCAGEDELIAYDEHGGHYYFTAQ